jgi:RND family efflux transporter MFP subunit
MRTHCERFIGGLLLALLVAVAGCSRKPAPGSAEAPKVTVMKPQPHELTSREEFNGWLEGDKTVDVRSRVRGHVQKVNFTDGQFVEKGQVLFELDPRSFEADVGRTKDKEQVFQAQRVAAEKEAARTRSLLLKNASTQEEYEKAVADASSLGAQVSAARNEIKRAEVELGYCKIKAEIAGRVSSARLTEGDLVNAGGGDPLLTTIVAFDPIRVYFNIDERSLLRYAKNRGVPGKSLTELLAGLKDTKATFTFALDGEKEFTHEGTLAFGDNRIDRGTGTIQLYGTADNKDGEYLPGSRVRVRLPVGKPYPALLVPETAILADQDKRYVLIVDDHNTVLRRNATLGALTDDGMRAIEPADKPAEGEEPGDWQVIVDNLQRARLNYPVDPQKPGL